MATDAGAYARLWDRLIGRGQRPEIDFTTDVAVFLLAGERNTGGYAVVPKAATVEGETLVIEADVTSPGRGTIVTQALTSPWTVIAVSRRDVKDIRWKE